MARLGVGRGAREVGAPVSEYVARNRATYDKIAARFFEVTRDRSAIAFWHERFARRLGGGSAVLDLGAGPGLDSLALRKLGLRAVALDLSIGMLRAGHQEFPAPRVQADARRLPMRSEAFAGVWAHASLLHLSPADAATALREIRRVLQRGGVLHVAVKSGAGAGWESERYGEPRWFQYWSALDFDALLATSGFEVDESWFNPTRTSDWLIRHALVRGE